MTDTELAALIALGEKAKKAIGWGMPTDPWDDATHPDALLPLLRELQAARAAMPAFNALTKHARASAMDEWASDGHSKSQKFLRLIDGANKAIAAYDGIKTP